MKQRLPVFAAALWWGSLTTLGFGVVPLLFANLATPAMAGNMAARLFSAQTWVSVVCCLLLLMLSRAEAEREIEREIEPETEHEVGQHPVQGAGQEVVQETGQVRSPSTTRLNSLIALVLAGLLLVLLNEYGVAPHIVARDNIKLWHGVGSTLYLVQWLLSGTVLWRLVPQGD